MSYAQEEVNHRIFIHIYTFNGDTYREHMRDLHMVFIDLEKSHDRTLREVISWALVNK